MNTPGFFRLSTAYLGLLLLESAIAASGATDPAKPIVPDWQFTRELPAADWLQPGFKENSAWTAGKPPFGSVELVKAVDGTAWTAGRLWLRGSFDLAEVPSAPELRLRHRGDVEVYVNGHPVADFSGNTPGTVPAPIQGKAQSSLKPGRNWIAVQATCIGANPLVDVSIGSALPSGKIPAPLYRDPRFDGAADPTIIWDRQRRLWTMFYTQRRASVKNLPGVGFCFGSDIGRAVSRDGGRTWLYDGEALGLEFEGGRNTFWAPEVFHAQGNYHMLVTYIRSVRTEWGGNPVLVHFTSPDLKHWTFSHEVPIQNVIDGAVFPLPEGGWRLYFKRDSRTFMADSSDLRTWTEIGAATRDQRQEGPDVFQWKDRYWMIADVWRGQAVYHSTDLKTWTRQPGTILGNPGKRRDDAAFGRHADVIVQGDRAFIIYFTHPGGDTHHEDATSLKRTSIQIAELEYRDGRIECDRDRELDYHWQDGTAD